MNTKSENLIPVQFPELDQTAEPVGTCEAASRRAFVEPAVSFPVDVLESTTFFQFTESGATN